MATPGQLETARRFYEEENLSLQSIADEMRVTAKTVGLWKKKGQWADRGSKSPGAINEQAPPVDIPTTGFVTTGDLSNVDAIVSDSEPDDGKDAQIASLSAELEKYKAEAEKNRPTHDTSTWKWDTVEDVLEHYGERFNDIVAMELASTNRKRVSQGLGRIEADDRVIREKAQEFVSKQKRVPKGNCRVMKMFKPFDPVKNANNPRGSLIQVPIEGQINNLNGSQWDAIARYKEKGYKVATPMWCARQNCNEYAAVGSDGSFEFLGYCGREDMRAIEKINDVADFRKPENLITAASGLGR